MLTKGLFRGYVSSWSKIRCSVQQKNIFERTPASEPSQTLNAAFYLTAVAQQAPSRLAVAFPQGQGPNGEVAYGHRSFQDLDQESDRYAHGLTRLGIRRGCRVLLMVPPGIEFIAVAFALFKMGAILTLIDPGMGKKNLLNCIAQVKPEAVVAVPLLHALRVLYRGCFKSVRWNVTLGRRWFWTGATLAQVREEPWRPFATAPVSADDPAAIFFTTGTTGAPKGVLYLHGMLDAQIRIIRDHFEIGDGDVGLPAFAPFVLFCVAMGTPSVLPHMDPTKPAFVDPRRIIGAIERYGVTYSFGSPTFWSRVSQYCVEKKISLPSLKKIMMAGAPVPPEVLERLQKVLAEDGEGHTPYGATEALPVTCVTGSEILKETDARVRAGAGICVGWPLSGVALRIIEITDDAIPQWDDGRVLPPRRIGEIVVKGAIVTNEYYNRPEQTALAKIKDGDTIWHRMGDVGYLDDEGRLWFCGRKGQRVVTEKGTLFTIPCEAIFNQHEAVSRTALVGVGPRPRQRPVVIVEPREGKMPANRQAEIKFTEELLDLGRQNELTRDIKDILFHPSFPVDFRHNAKIIREQLAAWAKGKIG
ncbi:MAG: AMP-binding protein [Deltaproteobacteria bacterium]|nr:AMP-binding protein [Deltaproteobacteria bacterium]